MCGFNPGDAIDNFMDSGSDTVGSALEPAANAITKTDEIDQIMDSDLVQKGFPMLVMTILGQGAGGAIGGAGGEAGFAGEAGGTYPGTATAATGGAAAPGSVASDFATGSGATTNASDFLLSGENASAGSSAPVGTGEPGFAGESAPGATIPASSPSGGGLIQSAMDFAKKNPALSAAALQVGGGALQGVGNRANAKEIAERNISASRDLQQQKTQNAIELEEWKRRFAQNGSYFDALVPFKRSANTALARPDGSPVFQNGLIASRMAGG